MTNQMNDLIRRSAGVTTPSSRRGPDNGDDDLGEYLTVDVDQGQRTGHIRPSASTSMDNQIRRAAGISIRPGQRVDLPELGNH
jgi:hypothetical protein